MPLPENTIKITGLSAGTVKGGSLLATSEPDSSTPPVYSSSKVSAADIADFVANDKNYAELTETSDKTLIGAINEIAQGGGGGNTDYVELTQAQYDALEQAGTLDPTVLYFITDGQSGGGVVIDDSTTSASKVWSSDKTDDEIQAVAATVPAINDSSTASTVVWSADKISTELGLKQDDLSGGQLSNVDLNDYRFANANYWVTQTSVSNKPTTSFGYLEVIVSFVGSSSTTAMQRFTVFGNDSSSTRGDTYVRFYANNQWYNWNKVAQLIT